MRGHREIDVERAATAAENRNRLRVWIELKHVPRPRLIRLEKCLAHRIAGHNRLTRRKMFRDLRKRNRDAGCPARGRANRPTWFEIGQINHTRNFFCRACPNHRRADVPAGHENRVRFKIAHDRARGANAPKQSPQITRGSPRHQAAHAANLNRAKRNVRAFRQARLDALRAPNVQQVVILSGAAQRRSRRISVRAFPQFGGYG